MTAFRFRCVNHEHAAVAVMEVMRASCAGMNDRGEAVVSRLPWTSVRAICGFQKKIWSSVDN